MNYSELTKQISDSILKSVKQIIEKRLNYDRTFKAQITSIISAGKYTIKYCGKVYTISSSIPCTVGNCVRVCAPCNNWYDLYVVENKTSGKTLRNLRNPSVDEIYQIPDINGVSTHPTYIDNGFHNVTKYSNGIRIYSLQVYVYTSAINNSIIGYINPNFMNISQDLYGYAVDVKTDRIFLIQILPNGTVMVKTLGGSAIPEQALYVRGSVVF